MVAAAQLKHQVTLLVRSVFVQRGVKKVPIVVQTLLGEGDLKTCWIPLNAICREGLLHG